MSIRPEGRREEPPSKQGMRPCDDGGDDADVEVVLIDSDDDGEQTPTGTAREDVEVINVDTDSGGEEDGVAATGGSKDEGGGTWRHHAPVVGNLQRLPKGNASNVYSARDKLTRALKRQVWMNFFLLCSIRFFIQTALSGHGSSMEADKGPQRGPHRNEGRRRRRRERR